MAYRKVLLTNVRVKSDVSQVNISTIEARSRHSEFKLSNARDESNRVYRLLNLQPVTRPVPEPKAREILIQVYATGGTTTEKLWYTTSHYADGSTRSKAIPEHEFSVIVAGLTILADKKCT